MEERGPEPEPAAVRLELEELLSRRGAGPDGVTEAQHRLRGLLLANRQIISGLTLHNTLRSIVESACALVDAPYGALGVIAQDGVGLEEFIHVGLDDETARRIGHLPEGHGLLGALIADPRPIRLRDLHEDHRSAGFPDGHPDMRGFLGVPIRVRDEVFGNLYLAGPEPGEFDTEDEELVQSLAATAGVVIENARLFDEAHRRQDWLRASTEVTRQVLTSPAEDSVRLIARRVLELAFADAVAVVLPDETTDLLRVHVAEGVHAEALEGLQYPAADTVVEGVLGTGDPALVEDATGAGSDGRRLHLAEVAPLGPAMVLPLTGSQRVRGGLVVGRTKGGRRFTETDLEMALTFAQQAATALELAEARRDQQRVLLLEDRARIARDLHDHVIQELFAAGMGLQGVAGTLDSARAQRLTAIVKSLDESIRQIRMSIFQLQAEENTTGMKGAVLRVAEDVSRALGFEPVVRFEGPIGSLGDPALTEDVVAVVREALSNAARHAEAQRVAVRLIASSTDLTVMVTDDGKGIGETTRRSGLENLRQRAERRGGSLRIDSVPDHGTVVAWTAPWG